MSTALARREIPAEVAEKVVAQGDLAKLTPQERVSFYKAVCESIGLNELTRPFEYITLNGKLTLYARKDATDQLRRIYGVSVQIVGRETHCDVYVVTARATMHDGRADESTGAVSIKGLSGDALCNAYMKAETKAKRRVTLSVCGLGFLDESEAEAVHGARTYTEQTLPPPRQLPQADTESPEAARREMVRAVREVCAEMNRRGRKPEWSGLALKKYVNDKFGVTDGLDSLTFDSLGELGRDLSAMLDALNAEQERGEADDTEVARDDIPF